MQTEFAQYCKPQDLAKDFGGTASKAEKKNVNLRLVSYRNITKLLYLRLKLKEKKHKKKDEKKRKRLCPESNSEPPTRKPKLYH